MVPLAFRIRRPAREPAAVLLGRFPDITGFVVIGEDEKGRSILSA
jgi:hypothetical protein